MIVDNGNYYLYRHVRLDTNMPFYIGVGTRYKDKRSPNCNPYRRAYLKSLRSNFWKNVVNKTSYEVEILVESDDYSFIEEKEKEFINIYGREDLGTGTLVNFTDGGKGQRNVCNKKVSEETKRKMSEASKGRVFTDEHKKALSEAKKKNPPIGWKGQSLSEEHRKKISKAKLGKSSPHKGKLNIRLKEYGKKYFEVIVDGVSHSYNLSKTDLRKKLGLSLKTFNKILSGKQCKKLSNKIEIYAKEVL